MKRECEEANKGVNNNYTQKNTHTHTRWTYTQTSHTHTHTQMLATESLILACHVKNLCVHTHMCVDGCAMLTRPLGTHKQQHPVMEEATDSNKVSYDSIRRQKGNLLELRGTEERERQARRSYPKGTEIG